MGCAEGRSPSAGSLRVSLRYESSPFLATNGARGMVAKGFRHPARRKARTGRDATGYGRLMTHSIRSFLAIELPDEVKSALVVAGDRLREAGVGWLRIVRPDNVHLTLRFLGDIPRSAIEPIGDTVSRVARRHRPFSLELGEPGLFPPRGAPRVFWVGMAGDLDSLTSLHRDLEGSLDELGFERERRAFHPHLTVARIRNSSPKGDKDSLLRAMRSAGPIQGRIDVDAVHLIRSTLTPEGPIYERIASSRLGDPAV